MAKYYTEYKIKVDLHELDKVRKKLKKCGFTFRYSDRIKWKKTKENIRQACADENQSFAWIYVYVGEGLNDLLWDVTESEAIKLPIDKIEEVLGDKKEVLEEPITKSYKVKIKLADFKNVLETLHHMGYTFGGVNEDIFKDGRNIEKICKENRWVGHIWLFFYTQDKSITWAVKDLDPTTHKETTLNEFVNKNKVK